MKFPTTYELKKKILGSVFSKQFFKVALFFFPTSHYINRDHLRAPLAENPTYRKFVSPIYEIRVMNCSTTYVSVGNFQRGVFPTGGREIFKTPQFLPSVETLKRRCPQKEPLRGSFQ
jgi:hypothetical protein